MNIIIELSTVPQEHFERSSITISFLFCAYWALTLHALYICFGTYSSMFRKICEICRREVCENFPHARSSSSTLVYCHRHLFSCNIFGHEHLLSPGKHSLVNRNLRLKYFLFITSYCFIFDICLKWIFTLRTSYRLTNRGHLDALIGRKFFYCPPGNFQLPMVDISNLRLLAVLYSY